MGEDRTGHHAESKTSDGQWTSKKTKETGENRRYVGEMKSETLSVYKKEHQTGTN